MERHEGFFHGRNSTELFYQSWMVENPRATVLVTHGQGEHSECYNRLVDALVPNNLSVIAWDLRGHGRSDGKRGFVADFTDYISDHHHFVKKFESQISSHPFFLLGHSMGGLITLRSLLSNGSMGAKAVLLSSPLLGLSMDVPPIKDLVAKLSFRLFPKLTLNNEIKDSVLTHEEDIIREYNSDPYRHTRISPGVFLGFMQAIDDVFSNVDKMPCPMFLQLSGQDKVVSTESSKRFFEKVNSPKESITYGESFHEIYNDHERDKVFKDLNKYIDSQLGDK